MSAIWSEFVNAAVNALPISPFYNFINSYTLPDGIGWLNWFLPISDMIGLLLAWVTAYGVYLLIRAVLRWIKIVS